MANELDTELNELDTELIREVARFQIGSLVPTWYNPDTVIQILARRIIALEEQVKELSVMQRKLQEEQ